MFGLLKRRKMPYGLNGYTFIILEGEIGGNILPHQIYIGIGGKYYSSRIA